MNSSIKLSKIRYNNDNFNFGYCIVSFCEAKKYQLLKNRPKGGFLCWSGRRDWLDFL